MQDYYRIRFHKLRPPRRASSWSEVHGLERPPMPRLLKFVYQGSVWLVSFGWVAVVLGCLGGGSTADIFIAPLIIAFPVAVWFAIGFSEDARWTRPAIVVALAVPSAFAAYTGFLGYALLGLLPAMLLAVYLYAAKGPRRYYQFLRDTQLVQIRLSDLTDPHFYALELAVVGAVAGAGLVRWLLSDWIVEAPYGIHTTFGVLSVMAVGAVVVGVLGWCAGEWLLKRAIRRHPESQEER